MSRMPVVFVGHGNPMHAIWNNAFTQALGKLGASLPRPRAILCVSAHWLTEGTWVTHMARPKTIHDFRGFPKELFEVRYPAPGSPAVADEVRALVESPEISPDGIQWGLDHGAWAILKHMYPKADVPVVQLSINLQSPPAYHFDLGMKLRPLRDKGILILGSGNVVHNLKLVNFAPEAKPYPWAVEFDDWVKERLGAFDYATLVNEALSSEAGKLSIPTPDHWYPLLYVLGAGDGKDHLRFDFEGIESASLSLRTFSLVPP